MTNTPSASAFHYALDEIKRLRVRYVTALTWASLILTAMGMLATYFGVFSGDNLQGALITSAGFGLSIATLTLIRRNQIDVAAMLLIAVYTLSTFAYPPIALLTGTIAIITAAALAGTRLFLLTNALVLGKIGYDIFQYAVLFPVFDTNLVTYSLPLFSLAIISIVTRFFIDAAQRSVENSRRTSELLQASADIGRMMTQTLDFAQLVERTVNLIRDRFGYYHVQIFTLSETGDQAVLTASTGDVGRQLLERRHQLTIGSQSVIGQVVLRRAPVLVSDTEGAVVYYHNDLLPNTRAELAFPLLDGDKVVGALDLQSTIPNDFAPQDRQALEIVADLLSTALRDVRLFSEQQQAVDENRALWRESRQHEREIERLNGELTRSTWQDYLSERQAPNGVTLDGDRLVAESAWTETLARAGQQGQVVRDGDQPLVAVPVILRGEVIGAIEVEAGEANEAETVEIAQAIAQRFAVSLENARLYEETRQTARQEQQINDIAARFGAATSVDELLRVTLTELGQTLGARGGSIRLGRIEAENGATEA